MKQITFNRLQLDNSGTFYYHPAIAVKADGDVTNGEQAGQSTENDAVLIVPTDGNIRNLKVVLDAAPTSGKSWTFDVRKNGADTAVDTTIADTDTEGDSVSDQVAVSAGDLISIKVTSSGTPTNTVAQVTLELDGDAEKMHGLFGGARNHSANAYYVPGVYDTINTNTVTSTRNKSYVIVPYGATVKGMYVNLTTAPGVGASRTITLNKGPFGSVNATSVTVTISDTDTSGSITGQNVDISDGDVLLMSTTVASGPASSKVMYTLILEGDIDGESMYVVSSGNSSRFDGYEPLIGGVINTNSGAAGDDVTVGPTDVTFKDMRVQFDVFFNPADSKVYYFQKNGADTLLTITVNSSTRTGTSTNDEVVTQEGDDVNIRVDHTGTSTSTGIDSNLSMVVEVPVGGPKGLTTLFAG